ncbi:MAG: hypothetical protein EBY32_14210 [Proteobacteria bacterium]|nr:hypothetical protein [Pseudomonadota bacterium]
MSGKLASGQAPPPALFSSMSWADHLLSAKHSFVNVSDLREILQYVPLFRERIFVVAVDGEVVDSENFPNILLDVAVLRSLSIKVVLVHGASHQIEALAATRGIAITNSDGIGLTDEPTLQISIDAAIRLTNEIMEGLSSVDLRAAYTPVRSSAWTPRHSAFSSTKASFPSFLRWALMARDAPTG